MTMFGLFLVLGIVTYLSRRIFLRLPGNWLSPRMRNGLTYIPVGIFAALIFPSLFVQGGQAVFQPLLLAASLVCLLLMAISKNVFISFGVSLGLVVLVSLGVIPWG